MPETVFVVGPLALLAVVTFVVLFWLEVREAIRATKAPPPAPVVSSLAQVLAMPRRPSAMPRRPIPDSQNHRPG